MNRFFLQKFASHIKDPDLVHQISRVLRMQPGEQFIVCLNDGFDRYLEILDLNNKFVHIKELRKEKNNNELTFNLSLYFGLIKHPKRISFLIEKCTELGVKNFYPLICERSQVKDLKKADHLKEVIRESCEQCDRAIMPILHKPISFSELDLDGTTLMPAINSSNSIRDLDIQGDINIVIGPEGGFSESEIEIAKSSDFKFINLGPRILRSETASIVACSQIVDHWK